MKKFNFSQLKTVNPHFLRVVSLAMTLVLSLTSVTLAWYTNNGTITTNERDIVSEIIPEVVIEISLDNQEINQPYRVRLSRLAHTVPALQNALGRNDTWYVPSATGKIAQNSSIAYYEEIYMTISLVEGAERGPITPEEPQPLICTTSVGGGYNIWSNNSVVSAVATSQDTITADAVEYAVIDTKSGNIICHTDYAYGESGQKAASLTTTSHDFTAALTELLVVMWLDGSSFSTDTLNGYVTVTIDFNIPGTTNPTSQTTSQSTGESTIEPTSETSTN